MHIPVSLLFPSLYTRKLGAVTVVCITAHYPPTWFCIAKYGLWRMFSTWTKPGTLMSHGYEKKDIFNWHGSEIHVCRSASMLTQRRSFGYSSQHPMVYTYCRPIWWTAVLWPRPWDLQSGSIAQACCRLPL